MVSIQQVISLESYLKIDHHVSKLLSVEMFNIISINNEMGCRELKRLCVSETVWYSWSLYTTLESYREASKFINFTWPYLVHCEFISTYSSLFSYV